MAPKNVHLKKQRMMFQNVLDAGERIGMQKMWDFVQIALREKSVIGKDTFGADRLKKLFLRVTELDQEYRVAFTMDVEADYYREKLDRSVAEPFGKEGADFYARYPDIKEFTYKKAQKGWT